MLLHLLICLGCNIQSIIMMSYKLDKYDKFSLKILMVSTEYPPIPGGVGRYAKNLTEGLKVSGMKVSVLCNEKGKWRLYGY